MIKVTAVKPHERFQKIKANLQEKNNAFKNDPHAQAFGISVSDKFHELNGRVLNSPSPTYVNAKGNNTEYVQSKNLDRLNSVKLLLLFF